MKILILGGGISGLSAAWFLKQKNPQISITLLEKTDRLGGWIQTTREKGVLFEKGPRTFAAGRCPSLLELISDLGLNHQLLSSDPRSAKRFLLYRGRLRSAGSLLPQFLPALIREPFIKASELEEESIYDFAVRRFNRQVAETLFDPLTLGIYGGDIRTLSVHSCFPKFVEWEREKGAILKGMFGSGKGKKGLFTLQGGMETLIEELQKQLEIETIFHCEVEKIQAHEVLAGGRRWPADRILSALPLSTIGRLAGEVFSMKSLSVVQLVYPLSVFSKKGYGYLVPSQERQSILGMIWDSAVFPEQGREARLTAMIREEDKDPLKTALNAARDHLGIRSEPLFTSVHTAFEAIPQFEVGYKAKLSRFQSNLKKDLPFLSLLGNYFGGASVEAALCRSRQIVNDLASVLK